MQKLSKDTKKNFLNGALVLTGALIIVKIIGFIYKIPLVNMLGGDGYGYYNDAYQVYSLLFVISTGGIPVAIAKLVSESNAVGRINEPKKILSLSLKVFSIVGVIGTLVLIFFAKWFATVVVKTPGSTISIVAIAPAIFFVSLGASFKGFFQGYKDMKPTAVYQILEAASKLLGLGVVLVLLKMGYKSASVLACGAILGVTFGSLVSTTYMFIRFYFGKDPILTDVQNPVASRNNSALFRAMIKIAIPVTLSSSIMTLTSTIDMISVKQALINSGLPVLTEKEIEALKEAGQRFVLTANSAYGAYTGCTTSLFNLPPTITQTIGISVLPFISELFAKNRAQEAYKNMDSSMRIVSLLAAPCAVGMSFFSFPILSLLFGSKPDEVALAAPAFTILALGIYLVAMSYPTSLFLQACGRVNTPLIAMGIGAVLKLVTNYILVSQPSLRINGAPYGTLLCYGSILVINLVMLYRTQRYKPQVTSVFIKPIVCSVTAVGCAYLVYKFVLCGFLPLKLACLGGIAMAGVLYVILVFVLKALCREDVLLLPKGEKIADFLTRKGIIKQ